MSTTTPTPDNEAQWLRTVVLPKILKSGKLLQSYTEDAADSFKVHDIEIQFVSSEEIFLQSLCYRATIKFEFAGVTGSKALFVKRTPEVPANKFGEVSYASLFNNEITAYQTLLPALEQFAHKPLHLPKYLYGELENNNGAVVLEDFTAQGWRLSKVRFNLPQDHVLLAVRYLAYLHGLGYAMKQTYPHRFEVITRKLQEIRYAKQLPPCNYKTTLEHCVQRLPKVTRKYQPDVDEAFLQKLTHLLADINGYGKQRVRPVEPFATLCHGDYLRNNLAFKFANENDDDAPQDVLMFDLQTMRVASPMLDIATFLTVSAFAEVRHTNFVHIFDAYITELGDTFARIANAPLPAFLTEELLLDEYIRYLPYGINVAASFLCVLVEPLEHKTEDTRTNEELIEDALTRGGAVVDRELAHQVKELYELSQRHGVDIAEGIEL